MDDEVCEFIASCERSLKNRGYLPREHYEVVFSRSLCIFSPVLLHRGPLDVRFLNQNDSLEANFLCPLYLFSMYVICIDYQR